MAFVFSKSVVPSLFSDLQHTLYCKILSQLTCVLNAVNHITVFFSIHSHFYDVCETLFFSVCASLQCIDYISPIEQPPRTLEYDNAQGLHERLCNNVSDVSGDELQEDTGPDIESLINRMLTLNPQASHPSSLPGLDSSSK